MKKISAKLDGDNSQSRLEIINVNGECLAKNTALNIGASRDVNEEVNHMSAEDESL